MSAYQLLSDFLGVNKTEYAHSATKMFGKKRGFIITSLRGGAWAFSDGRKFLDLYTSSIKNGDKWSLQVPISNNDIFRLFADIDGGDSEAHAIIESEMTNVISSMLDIGDCKTETLNNQNNSTKMKVWFYHVIDKKILPIYVSKQTAREIVQRVIEKVPHLKDKDGKHILDENYSGNRLVGTWKFVTTNTKRTINPGDHDFFNPRLLPTVEDQKKPRVQIDTESEWVKSLYLPVVNKKELTPKLVDKYLPISMLSTKSYIETPLFQWVHDLREKIQKEKEKRKEKWGNKKTCQISQEAIQKLLEGLDDSYVNDRVKWMKIIFALKHEGENNYELAVNFSIRTETYDEFDKGGVYDLWEASQSTSTPCTLGTIIHAHRQCIDYQIKNKLKNTKELLDEYNEEVKKAKAIRYDPSEKFYVGDYILKHAGKSYTEKTMNEIWEELVTDLRKCVLTVKRTKNLVVCKDNKKELFSVEFENDFLNSHKNEVVSCVNEKEKVVKMSIFQPLIYDKRLQFTSMDCIPWNPLEREPLGGLTSKTLNVFPGFVAKVVDKIDPNKINPVLDIIKNVLANNNEKVYHYVLSFFASMIQRPAMKTRRILIFRSVAQQIGKGTIMKFFRDFIFGKPLSTITKEIEQIVGKFNGTIRGKLFINLDELPNADKSMNAIFEKIKNLVTEDAQIVELKGKETQEMFCPCNFVITTNSENPVKMDAKDKKYVPIECGEMYDGDDAFFDHFYKTSMNQEVGNHIFTYLLHYPICNLNQPPMTDFRNEIMDACKPSQARFIEAFKSEDYKIEFDDNEKRFISTDNLYSQYRNWCVENGLKDIINSNIFARTMTKMNFQSTREYVTVNSKKQQLRGYTIKSINE